MGGQPFRRRSLGRGRHLSPQRQAGPGIESGARGKVQAHFIRLHFVAARKLQAEEIAAELEGPGVSAVADHLADNDPQKRISLDYKRIYEDRYKIDVSTFGGYAYDGLMMSVAAIKKVGSTDKVKVRAALEQLKNFYGVNGIYNMTATDHMGLDQQAFRMAEIKGGKFVEIK